jgi:hypothetical protein
MVAGETWSLTNLYVWYWIQRSLCTIQLISALTEFIKISMQSKPFHILDISITKFAY